MAQSFTATASAPTHRHRSVLVTGAAGRIGSYFAEHSHTSYALRLMVHGDESPESIEHLRSFGEIVTGDIGSVEQMKQLCAGIDTVLHLAGDPSPTATWDSLLKTNVVGTYNTFVAAKHAKCRRVVYASSIHAISGYPADVQVKSNEPINPGDLYGVSKCFGEAMARYMAEQEGVSAICIRIGGFQPIETARSPDSVSLMDAFVSRRDLTQLLQRCIDAEHLKFAILSGLSDNRFKRMDISDARELVGYSPQDDFTAEHPKLQDLQLASKVMSHNLSDGGETGIRNEAR